MRVYRVEIKHETITPVCVAAGSKQEAIERVLRNEGEAGDSYHGDTEVISIRCKDG